MTLDSNFKHDPLSSERDTVLPIKEASRLVAESAHTDISEAHRLLNLGIELHQRGELQAALSILQKAHLCTGK
jgi:hypothetical protein